MTSELLAMVPIWYVAFLFSTVAHEAAHALVAKWGGDDTAYAGGQVTLDPTPHIRREPFGLVVVPLLMLFTSGMMIGWGSAPYNPYWQVRYPKRAALMALAGPLTNLALALITGIIIRILIETGVFGFPFSGVSFTRLVSVETGGFLEGLATLLSVLFSLNVILFAFNLIPFPPLDGYTVLGLVLPERLSLKMIELSHSPMFSIFGILIAWKIFPLIAPGCLKFALGLLYI